MKHSISRSPPQWVILNPTGTIRLLPVKDLWFKKFSSWEEIGNISKKRWHRSATSIVLIFAMKNSQTMTMSSKLSKIPSLSCAQSSWYSVCGIRGKLNEYYCPSRIAESKSQQNERYFHRAPPGYEQLCWIAFFHTYLNIKGEKHNSHQQPGEQKKGRQHCESKTEHEKGCLNRRYLGGICGFAALCPVAVNIPGWVCAPA